jgi:hypothetical protein
MTDRPPAEEQPPGAEATTGTTKAWKCVDCGYEDDDRWLMCPECATAEDWAEIKRHVGETTDRTYRMHLIYQVRNDLPRSFRTQCRAPEFLVAWAMALNELNKLAHDEGWTGMYQLLSYSCATFPAPAPLET